MEHRPGQLHGNADGLSRLTWEGTTSAEQDEEDAMLFQSINVEPLSKECIKAARKQEPVLSQVVDWLKNGARPARSDVEGGGLKLLSYWSQWGRLFLKDGLVFGCWENEVTGQEIYQQKVLCLKCCMPFMTVLSQSPWCVENFGEGVEEILLAWHA